MYQECTKERGCASGLIQTCTPKYAPGKSCKEAICHICSLHPFNTFLTIIPILPAVSKISISSSTSVSYISSRSLAMFDCGFVIELHYTNIHRDSLLVTFSGLCYRFNGLERKQPLNRICDVSGPIITMTLTRQG